MHTFVKYVKYAAIAYLHKTDMPILFANERNNKQSQQERRTTRSIERQTPVSTWETYSRHATPASLDSYKSAEEHID